MLSLRAPVARLAWSLYAWRRNPGWRRRMPTIRRLRRLSPAAFAAWQGRAVSRHVGWAGATIPWWRGRVRPGAALQDLPILRRHDLQQDTDALRDPTRPVAALQEDASGGSTGEPVRLWHDRTYESWVLATEVHVMETWGLPPWCRTAYVWGADRDVSDIHWRERLWIRLKDRHVLNAFQMGDADLARFVRVLERLRPRYVQGYATALDLLASHLLARGASGRLGIEVVRSSAEVLAPAARARIAEAFGARVYDFYGSRECACLAAECPAGGLHVQGHGRVLEIVDDDGAPAAPGVPGRVLVTDLTNRAFGLLRYETGDVASWAPPEPCPCGMPYPRLERVHGRTSDFITTPAGDRVHGEWFTHLFYGRAGVDRFQVRQRARDHLTVQTVGVATEADLADLLAAIRERMGTGVTVEWQSVERIDVSRSGKRRFTISDVPYLPEA